jgi:hypothetical protein
MKPTPKLKLAQTRALWDENTGGPTAPAQEAPPDAARPDAEAFGVAPSARKPDSATRRPDERPRGAAPKAVPEVDPVLADYFPNGVPAPLNDAVTGVLDILWQNGATIGPFDSPDCATASCPRCGCKRGIEVREQGDAALVSLRCSCGPTWFLQRFRHVKAFVEYAPAPLRR